MRVLFLLIFLSACSNNLDDRITTLVENKNKWINSGIDQKYSYRLLLNQNRGGADIVSIIVVNDGKVVSVLTQDGKPRKIAPTLNLLITDHFKSILQYIKRDNLKLKVEYDKTLGYPSLIKTWSPGVFDSGSIIRISNVETDNVFNHKMSVGLDKGDLGSD